jgi:hypothetical protein
MPEGYAMAMQLRRKNAPSTDKAESASGSLVVPDRQEFVAVAAYYRAERRGFAGGDAETLKDWLEAEAEFDRLLSEAMTGP